MANYMKEVTMLLGLELNKEFHIEEHKGKFRIIENGVEAFYDDDVDGIRKIISLIPM
ncbi:hypothetical protein [Bullifex porci]|uniref:hypothetical protein n=1 Tax=Bullifex porci TaxID=2606638 RepID=UPI0023F025C4|nr:hypothetical protein [Bullifex porci]MDD7256276.1 hypothetical protein [Bullifex porci]